MAQLNAISPNLRDYARELQHAGFTVYAAEHPRLNASGEPIPLQFFHYAKDGYFGTVQEADFWGYSHSMPTKPTREYGSAVGTTPERIEQLTVADAVRTARPRNANPIARVPSLPNATPWGIGVQYTELEGEDAE